MSDKKDSKVHNLYEYNFAKQVVNDVPQIVAVLDEFQSRLEPFLMYKDVSDVYSATVDSMIMLQMQYDAYTTVVDKKGKVE